MRWLWRIIIFFFTADITVFCGIAETKLQRNVLRMLKEGAQWTMVKKEKEGEGHKAKKDVEKEVA